MSQIIEVTIPSPGESITSVYIAGFNKQVGDGVKEGETLMELDSDKATLELPAPVEGTILEYTAVEGDEIDVGGIVARIRKEAIAETTPEVEENKSPQTEADAPGAPQTGPAARLEADKLNVDISSVEGTGVRGRVLKKDVTAAATSTALPVSTSNQQRSVRVKMTPMRKTIARRLVESKQSTAMLTTFNEADMSEIKRLRKRYQDAFVKKNGIKLGFMSFFVKAAIEALKEYKAVNAEIDGDDIVYKNYYNIGVAVSTERGLSVPVVRDADTLSFSGVEQAIADLAGKARDGKLRMSDFKDGTFTISNGGVFGSLMSTPILNPPQVGILGMHTIQERPVNVNGQVEIRPMMYLALSYDHRIIDGRQAVGFLKRIKELVENPERILFEV